MRSGFIPNARLIIGVVIASSVVDTGSKLAGVSDPNPDWIWIQMGQRIRIRIRNPYPDPGRTKLSPKKGKIKKFHF
jgi:hypothetical protein